MRFIVGIDLGTTNCAVAYVPRTLLSRRPPPIRIFEVPQLARPGAVEPRPLLPSFIYLPASHELPAGSTKLPWDKANAALVGELARALGAAVPDRLVASAKSWLCSPSVDRTAAILPWGAPADVQRLSPIEASARYLAHIRDAWDACIAKGEKAARLATQDIVITVPASFDEVARELTVDAARLAGLPRVTLLEEPQAAFYAWLAAHGETLVESLASVRRVLVCDVGGGTTDFSLIDVQPSTGGAMPLELKRIAVSDHLMLGGDNMDLALARYLESTVPGHLDAQQFKALTAAARDGKERLLSDGGPEKLSLAVLGRGSRAIGGSVRTELRRDEALRILLDGFFPVSPFDAELSTVARFGLREWGLPYVSDPAVTRHLSQFLRRHPAPGAAGGIPRPDAVLFNGGALKPRVFRAQIVRALQEWSGSPQWQPVELANPSLDLAVALGAAYYGCVRRGAGVRIGGGIGRAYYIGIETDSAAGLPAGKAAVCLVPQGAEEGAALALPQTFILRLGAPVVFPLFASSVRAADKLGAVVAEESSDLAALPPLETTLSAGHGKGHRDVAVRLHATLNAAGTLALALKALHGGRSWEVHLKLRPEP